MGVTRFSVTVKKTINLVSQIFLILYIYLYIYNISTNSCKNMVVYRTVTLQQRNKIVPFLGHFILHVYIAKKHLTIQILQSANQS